MLTFVVFLLSALFVHAQGISEVYRDDFDDNKGHWKVGNWSNGSATIANGIYTIDRIPQSNEWYIETSAFVDYDADYDIEMKVRQVSGVVNHGYGISWGAGDAQNSNGVVVSADGRYKIYTWRGGRQADIIGWTPIEGIPPQGTWHILTVRKRGSGMSLLLDGTTIVGFENLSISGGNLGVVLNNKMKIELDYFVIKQVPKPIVLAEDHPINVPRVSLGPSVNCSGGDLSPVITANGKRLYFGRYPFRGNMGDTTTEDIWYTDLQKDGSWGAAQNAGSPLNNEGANFLISISPDENSVLLGNTYSTTGRPRGAGVSSSVKTSQGWSIPKEVRIDNYYNRHRFSESCLDPSGMILMMAIQRDDSRGQKDLYFSQRKKDGTFSTPTSCGPDLNTWGSEMSPFLAADGTTLYFASDGRRGFGGVDIWMTRRLDDSWTRWSEPKNLGPSINSPEWDAYYTVPARGDYAYLCGMNPENGSADLYRIKLTKGVQPNPVVLVSGRVLDASTKKPIATNVEYESLTKSKIMGIARSEPNQGAYKIVLPAGDLYGFRAEAPGYYPVSDRLDTRDLAEYAELTRDLLLVPIRKNVTIVLNNLFFDFSKSDIRQESIPELNRLAQFLAESPKITIELSGHTDNVGGDAANKVLSQDRVNAVKLYLQGRGVGEARMKAVGYGKSKPLATNVTDKGRQRNRRVEFKILSM
ncbi:MAG: OmpA family protein [Candidatus Kapabacteria bacterium]|nr:OmpA family protein [Candidatus Kapabacteria bacterium]